MQVPVLSQRELEAQMHNNLANQLMQDGQLDTAIVLFRKSINLNPLDLKTKANLAAALASVGQMAEAEALALDTLKYDPRHTFAWSVLGFISLERKDMPAATEYFEKACALRPESGMTQFDRCAPYLLSGDWIKGWEFHEGRRTWKPERVFTAPTWKGEYDKTVYVWAEQGQGDCIQFARYIPWLSERVKKVVFGVHTALFAIMQGYNKWAEVVPFEQKVPVECELALMSLAYFHKTTPDNVPPDPGVLRIANATGNLAGNKKIGIVWAGNKGHARDKNRSIPFNEILKLCSNPNLTFYSFQVGDRAQDITAHRAQSLVTDLSGIIEPDWSISGALLKQCDALITVDTAMAHLAGALGIKTALMLSTGVDWRWMLNTDKTPWYPNTTLFRQDKLNDWTPVIQNVAEWLKTI